jgi:hypothetical protein
MTSRRLGPALLFALGLLLLVGAGVLAIRNGRSTVMDVPEWATLPPRSTWTVTAIPLDTVTPISSPSSTATALPPSSSPTPSSAVVAANMTTTSDSPSATPSASPSPSATLSLTATSAPPTSSPTRTPVLDIIPTPLAPRIRIEAIDLVAAIVPVSWSVSWINEGAVAEWEVAEPPLVGHHVGSANLGAKGNVVLSAHGREGAPFAGLERLQAGDRVVLEDGGSAPAIYVVTEVLALPDLGADHAQRLANAGYMGLTDGDRLTLITCWPSWAYTHRLVVIAVKLEP